MKHEKSLFVQNDYITNICLTERLYCTLYAHILLLQRLLYISSVIMSVTFYYIRSICNICIKFSEFYVNSIRKIYFE